LKLQHQESGKLLAEKKKREVHIVRENSRERKTSYSQ